jgi:hypothetical protein
MIMIGKIWIFISIIWRNILSNYQSLTLSDVPEVSILERSNDHMGSVILRSSAAAILVF